MGNPTCDRCKTTYGEFPNKYWNATVKNGVVVGYLCPNCQTLKEWSEATINEATTSYSTDAFGRLVGTPKDGDQ